MKCVVSLLAILFVACGSTGTKTSSSGNPVITGDTCSLHQDPTSCQADSACAWYSDTRPCVVGQPCPAGSCYLPQAGGGGGVGAGISAACACPGSSAEVCMEQIGGPAVQVGTAPAITCVGIHADCSASDRCSCLVQGSVERCWTSDQVTNLCICDDGMR